MALSFTPAQIDRVSDILAALDKPESEITEEDFTQLLDPPRLPSRTLQERLEHAASYHPTQFEARLLTLTDKQLAIELLSQLDCYNAVKVDDWIKSNRVAAARRLENHTTQPTPHPRRLLAWGYDDPFTGPIIRALSSLSTSRPTPQHSTETLTIARPTKEQVIALCADNRSLRQRCLDIINGTFGAFNILEYVRIRGDILRTADTQRLTARIEGRDVDRPDGYNVY